MINKESAFKEGFIKKAQQYGLSIKQAEFLFSKKADFENTQNAAKSIMQSAISPKNLVPGATEEFNNKLTPWLQGLGTDYGIGAGGAGLLAGVGGGAAGGLLGKGVGHLAGYFAGGTDEEKKEKQRSWGNTGAMIGGLGGAGIGGALAGLGGPIAGIWNADRSMSPPPTI